MESLAHRYSIFNCPFSVRSSYPYRGRSGFSLPELVLGLGLLAGLMLAILGLSFAALTTDSKVEQLQISGALAESELERFSRRVSKKDSPVRVHFWNASNGPYSSPHAPGVFQLGGVDYELEWFVESVPNTAPDRLRKLDLKVSWWSGEEGRAGYGRQTVERTRLVRESDLRD